jgi:6-pyruvoyltetrahydropterin/6-carboxytetrahydropterin synthase
LLILSNLHFANEPFNKNFFLKSIMLHFNFCPSEWLILYIISKSMTITPVIRVTKEFSFEMAHALWNYDGPCKNVHGHSYKMFVTISGTPVNDPGNPKNGMIIDFTDLKKIVRTEIIDVFDHAVTVPENFEKSKPETFREMFGNAIIASYQPTCENLVADFASRLLKRLPAGISLHSLRLYETATSFAEWFASDNE